MKSFICLATLLCVAGLSLADISSSEASSQTPVAVKEGGCQKPGRKGPRTSAAAVSEASGQTPVAVKEGGCQKPGKGRKIVRASAGTVAWGGGCYPRKGTGGGRGKVNEAESTSA